MYPSNCICLFKLGKWVKYSEMFKYEVNVHHHEHTKTHCRYQKNSTEWKRL